MDRTEESRLEALRSLSLLDTPPSESFDRITRMASQIFSLPIAAVSLTDQDRQWFKSRVGVDHWQIPREKAPCAQVAVSNDVLVVPDLLDDECYRDSLLAQSGIRFYAGAPLTTRDGHSLGAMCVLGTEPRQITGEELRALQDLSAMVMAQVELQHAFGRIDPVSGLSNRNQFADDLQDMARDNPGAFRAAVLVDMVEANRLAEALRVIGPSYLDDLVNAATSTLRASVPVGTRLYQVANTQFAYLLESSDDQALAVEAQLFCDTLRAAIRSHGVSLLVDPAVGVVRFHLGSVEPGDLLRSAYSAAQHAREAERAFDVYSPDLDDQQRRRFTILADMPNALAAADQLALVFQPRIDLRSGACVAVEALLRWRHPELGNIPPGEFMPLVEQTATIADVTQWVIREALRTLVEWRGKGMTLTVSINVSSANLEEDGFAAGILDLLHQNGLPSHAIELELTESAVIRNGKRALEQLHRLHSAGMGVAIDDFGTGYSSLAYLQEIPAGVLKIDRSFMANLDADERPRTLVKAMVSMAHDLGYRVVAEGVESEETLEVLRRLGCDEVQGYLISRPVRAPELEAWLADRSEPPVPEPVRLIA